MIWEFTVAYSIGLICFTFIYCFKLWIATKHSKPAVTREEFEELQNATSVIVQDHEAVQKIAEETKKMLSQANLAQGFRRPPTTM